MELLEGMAQRPKKDYQCDIRRRCDCGGYLKRFDQTVSQKLELYCGTCHRIHTFHPHIATPQLDA